MTNRNNAHWKCPHCNKRLSSDKLYRDLFFERLLAEIPQNVRKVELSEDGEWEAVDVDADSEPDSNDEDEEARPRSKREKDIDGDVGMRDGANGAIVNATVVKRNVEVVSLLSDDEDEVDNRQQVPSHGGKRGRAAIETELDSSRNVAIWARDPRKQDVVQRSKNMEAGAPSENAANLVPRKLLPYNTTMSNFPVGGMRAPLQPHSDRRNYLQSTRNPLNGHHKQRPSALMPRLVQHYSSSQMTPQIPETPATELSREMSLLLGMNSVQPIVQLMTHASEVMQDERFARGDEFDGPMQEPSPPSFFPIKLTTPGEQQDPIQIDDDLDVGEEEIEEEEEIVAVGNVTSNGSIRSSSMADTPGIMMVGDLRLNVPMGGDFFG